MNQIKQVLAFVGEQERTDWTEPGVLLVEEVEEKRKEEEEREKRLEGELLQARQNLT